MRARHAIAREAVAVEDGAQRARLQISASARASRVRDHVYVFSVALLKTIRSYPTVSQHL